MLTLAKPISGGARRAVVLATIGASVAGLTVAVGMPGTALAAGTYCGSANYNEGASWTDVKTANTPAIWDGPYHPFNKQPPGCNDLNLIEAAKTDSYAGWLKHSNGDFYRCAAGYLSVPSNTVNDWVLCTSVATGTTMAVDPYSDAGDTNGNDYTIKVND